MQEFHGSQELFWSDHSDHIEASTVIRHCRVHTLARYKVPPPPSPAYFPPGCMTCPPVRRSIRPAVLPELSRRCAARQRNALCASFSNCMHAASRISGFWVLGPFTIASTDIVTVHPRRNLRADLSTAFVVPQPLLLLLLLRQKILI